MPLPLPLRIPSIPSFHSIIPEWNSYSIIAVLLYFVCAIVAFGLSIRCYSDTDETPVGLKLIFALLAAMWNVVYIVYYVIIYHIIGVPCT